MIKASLGQHLPEKLGELNDIRRPSLGKSFGIGGRSNWAVRSSTLEDCAEDQIGHHVGIEGESHNTRITSGKGGNS